MHPSSTEGPTQRLRAASQTHRLASLTCALLASALCSISVAAAPKLFLGAPKPSVEGQSAAQPEQSQAAPTVHPQSQDRPLRAITARLLTNANRIAVSPALQPESPASEQTIRETHSEPQSAQFASTHEPRRQAQTRPVIINKGHATYQTTTSPETEANTIEIVSQRLATVGPSLRRDTAAFVQNTASLMEITTPASGAAPSTGATSIPEKSTSSTPIGATLTLPSVVEAARPSSSTISPAISVAAASLAASRVAKTQIPDPTTGDSQLTKPSPSLAAVPASMLPELPPEAEHSTTPQASSASLALAKPQAAAKPPLQAEKIDFDKMIRDDERNRRASAEARFYGQPEPTQTAQPTAAQSNPRVAFSASLGKDKLFGRSPSSGESTAQKISQSNLYAPLPLPPISMDPMGAEVFRIGAYYYFFGMINDTKVKFRINPATMGINIPKTMATTIGIVDAEVEALSQVQRKDVIVPVRRVVFGIYPINAPLAKIIPSASTEIVDIGQDAIANFKLRDLNGRRILSRT